MDDHPTAPPGGALVFTPRARAALLTVFALLVALRIPRIWLHGRFMDEEGTIFFAYAWHRPALDALFRSFGGYLNIAANGTALAAVRLVRAGVLPLDDAPYLTMTVALLFQLLPAILILTGRATWLADRRAVIAALLIVAIAPKTEEVFVNILHIQFQLALCVGLILTLDIPVRRGARIGYAAVLAMAPLCGPGAIIMLPLFVVRSLIDRDRTRAVQTTVFAAATMVQLLIFFTPSPVRGHMLDPVTLASVMAVRLVALPLLTPPIARIIGNAVFVSHHGGGIGWWIAAAAATGYFGTLVVLALRDRRDAAIWLILAALGIGAVSFGGGMIDSDPHEWFSIGAGERYNFLPLVLLGLGLVVLAVRDHGRYRRTCAALCALTILSGAIGYPSPIKELRRGPDWSAEVAAWRQDHDHPLAGWPADWTIDLSDRNRPCPPPRSSDPATGDPSYCESAWLARVTRQVTAAARIARRTH